MQIELPQGWSPRHYQGPLWRYLENGGTRAIAIWHRRAGKDEVCLHRTACAMLERPATYWHMLPAYAQARKAIWTAINPKTGRRRIDEAFPHELRAATNEQEMFIRLRNHATWQCVGSDRYDAVVGAPPVGLTFSEWALSNPASWAYLAPIVEENNGWAVFITTSRGRNHAKSMLDHARKTSGWFHQVLTVLDTGAIPMSAVERARAEYHGLFGESAGDALIEQEYFCSFDAAVLGSYWGKELREAEQAGRIGKIEVARDLPVNTAWDIGVDDAMAIWCFQVCPDRIHIVDYVEGHGYGFDHYAAWLDERGYHGTDYVPHDAKIREPGTPGARTRIESMLLLGRKPVLVPNLRLMDGINAGRKTIPLAWFDEERCSRGLECLREYKADYDEEDHVFLKTPAHNWASHGADAWRYLSLGWHAPARPARPKDEAPRMAALAEMTYDEMEALAKRLESRERV